MRKPVQPKRTKKRPRHPQQGSTSARKRLNELLRSCDSKAPVSREEREWLSAKPVGRELI